MHGHLGIDKTYRHARDSVYWPGIDREIQAWLNIVNNVFDFRQ